MEVLFKEKQAISPQEAEDALRFCTRQVIRNLPEFTDKFQKAYSEGNFYQPTPNEDWTTGFWTGEIWLAYEYAREKMKEEAESLKHAAEVQVQSFLERIDNKLGVDHHDMGFLYSPSCVAAYKLTGCLLYTSDAADD